MLIYTKKRMLEYLMPYNPMTNDELVSILDAQREAKNKRKREKRQNLKLKEIARQSDRY